VAFYHERAAFYHEKTLFLANSSDFGVFSHLWLFIMNGRLLSRKKDCFLVISSDFGNLSHLWLFIMNGRLFITKKRLFFWPFYQISAILVICGFLS